MLKILVNNLRIHSFEKNILKSKNIFYKGKYH